MLKPLIFLIFFLLKFKVKIWTSVKFVICVKLINVSNFFETIVYLYSYLFIYNISLIFFFWSFFNFVLNHYKTIYYLNNLKFNVFVTTVFLTCLLSMAGVPPFLGFFSKLFILLLLSSSNFFVFYIFFFILLFLGLYFYVQNVRFLLTSKFSNSFVSFDLQSIQFTSYYLSSVFFLYSIIFGFFLLDDILLFFSWIFV